MVFLLLATVETSFMIPALTTAGYVIASTNNSSTGTLILSLVRLILMEWVYCCRLACLAALWPMVAVRAFLLCSVCLWLVCLSSLMVPCPLYQHKEVEFSLQLHRMFRKLTTKIWMKIINRLMHSQIEIQGALRIFQKLLCLIYGLRTQT